MRILRASCASLAIAFLAAGLTQAQSFPKGTVVKYPPRNAPVGLLNTLPQRKKTLSDLFNEIWQYRLKTEPEFASTIGDKRYNADLSDYSVAAYEQKLQQGRVFLMQLGQIDTDGMTDQEKLSKDLMVRNLVEEQEQSEFKPWEMPVTQFSGLQVNLPQLVGELTFTTAKDYDDYIARLDKVPTAFRQITDNMMLGMEDHRVPPKYLLEKVLTQVNAIDGQKPEDSPFARPLQKFPAGISAQDQARIRKEVLAAIQQQVFPAYQRFGKFLQGQYIAAGRSDFGLWSIPDGEAYYKFLVKRMTTTDLTPDEIHRIGVDQVERDETQILAIARKLGYADIPALRAALAADPKMHPTSADDLLSHYGQVFDRVRPKLPDYFGVLPKAQLQVKAVPAYLEKTSAPAYYEEGSPDGSRPGTIFVNTYDFAHTLLPSAPDIACHEGIPGHHLQLSIAQELTGLPQFRKYEHYTAYIEGWGLYAEQLCEDMRVYQNPYEQYGHLNGDLFRAVRLVVDTGVHSEHWSRQQMIDYMHTHTDMSDSAIQAEADRYIAMPGQALAYKVGQLKILELRARAQKELGSSFSYKSFDDEVLDSGALPLDVLESRLNDWIAAQKTPAKAQ